MAEGSGLIVIAMCSRAHLHDSQREARACDRLPGAAVEPDLSWSRRRKAAAVGAMTLALWFVALVAVLMVAGGHDSGPEPVGVWSTDNPAVMP